MRRALLTLLLLSSTALSAWADKRVALVMAADDYKNIRPLENAVNDAQAIEESLEKLGFEVTLETDRDLKRMRRALEDFKEDATGADVALVYFAGHGVEITGENRLLPTDADAASVETLKQTSLPLEEVRQTVASISKVGIILLDACRNDPFVGGDGTGRGAKALNVTQTPEVKPGFGRLGKAENLLYTFSAAPGATAADGSGENSPFTAGLAKYLGTDGLEIRSVLTLVQQEVYDLSRGKQLPYVENGLPQLFFASTTTSELPERERLLLAMADVTPDLRTEVERLAKEKDMPLAPLYGALISSDAKALSADDRRKKLTEAADAFVTTRTQMRTMASSDPAVAKLREEAEQQLALGAFDAARGKLTEAATIDSTSRDALKANYVERTTSEAATHIISGGASRADLNYDLAIASFQKAAGLYDDVERETLPGQQREQQLQVLESLGDLYLTVGNLAEGGKAYERQQAIANQLVSAEPANLRWQSSLANGMLKLGDVQRDQGDSSAALASYESGLDVRKKVAQSEASPAAAGLEAAAYLQLGALYKLQGNDEKALAGYEAARNITQQLVKSNPADEEIQATLARTYLLIGEIQQKSRKFTDAETSIRASLDIVKRLAETKPDDPARQFALADISAALGRVEHDLYWSDKVEGKDRASVASYDASIASLRSLIAADPKNTAYQRSLAGALEGWGYATRFGQQSGIDFDKVEASHKEAVEIRERLVKSDPTNKLWVGDLATSYSSLSTYYAFVPDENAAIEYSKKAHQATLDLAALDRKNVEWQRNATLYHAKISESYIQIKDYKAALDYEIKGLEYGIKVAQANPTMAIYFNDVSTIQDRIARIYWVQKDMKNYWAQNDVVLEQAQRNEKRFPKDVDVLRHLYSAYISVGKTWTKNDPQKALDLFKNAQTYAERAVSLDPKNPEFIHGIYEAQINSAYLIEQRPDRAATKAAYEAALATIEKAIALKPDEVLYTAGKDHVLARLDIVASGKPPPTYQ